METLKPDPEDLDRRRNAHASYPAAEPANQKRLFWTVFSAVLWALIAFSVIEAIASAIFARVAMVQAQEEIKAMQQRMKMQAERLRRQEQR